MAKYSKLGALTLSVFAGAAFMLSGTVYAEGATVTTTPTVTNSVILDPTQLDLGLSVSPVKFIFDANPGEKLTGQLTYYNATGSDLTLYLYTNNFESDNNTGNPKFLTEEVPYTSSLKSWIKFEKDSYQIKKVETTNTNALVVDYIIEVPSNAEAGGHYAAIMATINDPKKKLQPEGGNIAFSADTGALILLNVKGNVNRNLTLKSFTTVDPFSKSKTPTSLYEWMPAEFLVDLENTGNSHAFPMGNIIVYQGSNEVQKMIFNDAQSAILRESTRQYYTTMENGFVFLEGVTIEENGKQVPKLDGNGNTETKLSFDTTKFNKQFFGPYTAKLLLVYDDNGQKKTIISEKEFWVLPWKVILAIILVISAYAVIKVRSNRKED